MSQAAGGYYGLAQPSANHPAEASTGIVGVEAGTGCTWTATTSDDWIHFTSQVNGMGTNTVSYRLDANPDCSPRPGTILVGGKTFTVTQAASVGSYSLSAPGATFPPEGGSSNVTVTTGNGCTWNVVNANSWVTATPSSGTGSEMVSYSVAPFASGAARSGTLVIGGQTYTITQNGNDDFAYRIVQTDSSWAVTSSNEGATGELDEPAHARNGGGSSAWWSWTATADGVVTVSTVGSSFDTLLAVYTGNAVNQLTEVASDDDSGGDYTSELHFTATAGQTYAIAVDGYDGQSGTIHLALNQAPSGAPVITTTSPLPGGVVGEVYSTRLEATGGIPPYSWSIDSGVLPPWTAPRRLFQVL